MIGRQPGRLIESEIIRNLSTPSKIGDASWVKPGMMAWDHWWSGDTIMDTATIKAYIQLAADMGWEYQLIDWQWYGEPEQAGRRHHQSRSPRSTWTRSAASPRKRACGSGSGSTGPTSIVRLGKEDHAYKKAFPLYEKWGIAGVKIDFMDRDDQEMVHWYEKITAAAAEHKLMVNFHGAFKTSGFDRTYPEPGHPRRHPGQRIQQVEQPRHARTQAHAPLHALPRRPGRFHARRLLNRQPDQFKPNQKPTPVQGTRAAELALFVCYDSPVCCVCDHPDHIRDQPGADFLTIVPTVWDDTRVLDGAVGEHLVMARQSGDDWFLGAMTNDEAARDSREARLPRRLAAGRLKLWQDADDSGENAEHLDVDEQTVAAGDTITLKLAPAGGCVGVFERE